MCSFLVKSFTKHFKDCQPRVGHCPTCRDKHVDCRSLIAEKLLETTLKVISRLLITEIDKGINGHFDRGKHFVNLTC